MTLPAATYGDPDRKPAWKLPVYKTIRAMLANPFYEPVRTPLVEPAIALASLKGHTRKTRGHEDPREQWTVLIRDHHPGYLSWAIDERNEVTLAENAHMKKRMASKAC